MKPIFLAIESHFRTHFEFLLWKSEELPAAMKKFLSFVKARKGDGADSPEPEVSDDHPAYHSASNADLDCSVS